MRNDGNRSPALPVSWARRFALGGRGDLSGSNQNMSIQFVSANVTWKS